MPTVTHPHHAQIAQRVSSQRVDITSKDRRSAALVPQVLMLHPAQLPPTVLVARWVELMATATSGLRAKCAILGPSHPTMLMSLSYPMPHSVRIAHPEHLMTMQTRALHARCVPLEGPIQQRDQSPRVHAFPVKPADGPTLKECRSALCVKRERTVDQTISTGAWHAMRHRGASQDLLTLSPPLDTSQSSQAARAVTTRRRWWLAYRSHTRASVPVRGRSKRSS
jgi:hypothetical protein